MVRNLWRGTDVATGDKIEFHGFVLWRFANGKIVERWATVTPPKTVQPGTLCFSRTMPHLRHADFTPT